MQTLGRMPMQSSVRRDLCQEELTACLYTRSSLPFYLRKEMMYHPPSSFALTDSSGPERLWSNIHLGDVVAYLWLSAALLDFCKGTRLANVDGADKAEVMGMTDRILGMRGLLGAKGVDAMWHKKVTWGQQRIFGD
jgi:hypothetical protein